MIFTNLVLIKGTKSKQEKNNKGAWLLQTTIKWETNIKPEFIDLISQQTWFYVGDSNEIQINICNLIQIAFYGTP